MNKRRCGKVIGKSEETNYNRRGFHIYLSLQEDGFIGLYWHIFIVGVYSNKDLCISRDVLILWDLIGEERFM